MMIVNIICWSCRGLSSRDTSSRILCLIRTHKTLLVCLVETRANSDRTDCFTKRIPRGWDWAATLADGYSKGILVLWHNSIGQVSLIAVSKQALHIIISTNPSNNFMVSVIYNSTRFRKQCFLWHELSKLTSLRLPWIVLGDFNSILCKSEHRGGLFAYYDRKSRFFLDFVNSNNLIDLNFTGSSYTWCNNQSGLARRWARLDRCLVNLEWTDLFLNQ